MNAMMYEQEEKVFCKCDRCGGDIYVMEDYYDFDGDIVCQECFRPYVNRYFRRCAEE
jgi:formylmethanofuran dehydrogenase subunit E